MKILICLAMSCGLTAILYFYLKQKLFAIETRLNTLTELAQTLATELYNKEKGKEQEQEQEERKVNHLDMNLFKNVENDSESDSEGSTDSDGSSDSESDSESVEIVKIKDSDLNFQFKEVKLEPVLEPRQFNEFVIDISEPIVVQKRDDNNRIEVSDDEIEIEIEETIVEKVESKVIDTEVDVKHVSVDNDISTLSLKDLKQKVNDLGGPPLKTKQALINFLKKKV